MAQVGRQPVARAREPWVSAIVLAAGTSSRMGEPKPLVALAGRPLLAHVLDAVARSRVRETVVVLGAAAERVRVGVPLSGARIVENRAFADGLSSSIRSGVAAIDPEAEAFFVVLGDAPFVRAATLDALMAARERTGARVVVPVYDGVRGNPVLLDRSLVDEVDQLVGDRGCRSIRQRHPRETVEVAVDDAGVVIDLDTADDLDRARRALDSGVPIDDLARELARASPPASPERSPPRPRVRATPDIFGLAAELDRRREPFCLAIVTRVVAPTSGKPGFRAIVRPDGSIVGWVGGTCSRHALLSEARRALADGEPRVLRLRPGTEECPPPAPGVVDRVLECQSGGAMDIYVEPHRAAPQLVVVGDSPVAEALASLGRLLGYRVVAAGIELDPTRFPDADEIVGELDSLTERLDAESYAVVATMAQYDARALAALVRSPAAYVALVASRRRAGFLFDELRAQRIPEDAIARIRNPAGLDVGARTPEEIAVSVVAEMIQVRRRPPAGSGPTPEATGSPVAAKVEIDPVCHMEVDPATTPLRSSHGGTTYYFCSEGCVRRFEANPHEFLG